MPTLEFCDVAGRQIRVVTGPRAEPIHKTPVKSQCSIVAAVTEFDADFDTWIRTARTMYEQEAEVALVTQTLEVALDRFPTGDNPIEIHRVPVQSISSITYLDSAGGSQTLASANYILDRFHEPALIRPLYAEAWPVSREQPRSVVVTFVAGYATPFTASAGTDVITAQGRTFADGDIVRVQNSGGALPAGLSANTDYYVRDASGSTLKLSASSGGSAVDITDAGTGINYLGEVPGPALQAIRLACGHWWRSRESVLVGTISKEIEQGWRSLVMAGSYKP
jgi:uncharacterized phiE125 gp8 family phage protein